MAITQTFGGIVDSVQHYIKEEETDDFICYNYDFGVKAENVLLQNPDGTTINIQSSLFQATSPTEYNLVAEDDETTVKGIKWSTICDSLDNNTVDQILKPGDCIYFYPESNDPTQDFEGDKYFFPCYVLGVNTHNGKIPEEISLPHIDFMIPSLYHLIYYLNNHLSLTGEENLNTEQVFNIEPIKDNLNQFTAHPFKDSIPTSTQAYNYLYSHAYDGTHSLGNCIVQDCLHLTGKEDYLARKLLLVETNGILSGFYNFFGSEVNTFLENLTNIYQSWQNNSTVFPGNDLNTLIWSEGHVETYINNLVNNTAIKSSFDICTAKLKMNHYLKIQRKTINLDNNNFLSSDCFKFIDNDHPTGKSIITAALALAIQRKNVGITPEIDTKLLYKFIMGAAHYLYLVRTHQITSQEIEGYAFNLRQYFWGLTEYEMFGHTVYGHPNFSAGQCFQYPLFENIKFKDKIVQAQLINGDENFPDFASMTLSANLDSYGIWIGYDKNLSTPMCPQEISALAKYDAPFCFRLQATSSI